MLDLLNTLTLVILLVFLIGNFLELKKDLKTLARLRQDVKDADSRG